MYLFYVGIDVSKKTIDVSFSTDRNISYLSSFTNNSSGFKRMIETLKDKTDSSTSKWLVCFEKTGTYSKLLLQWLCSMAIPCKEENPLQISKSMGIRRGKNDQINSKLICQYAYEKRDTIVPSKLPKPFVIMLKKLITRREMINRHKIALEVSVKQQKSLLAPELLEMFTRQNESLIGTYKEQLKQIDQLIQEAINEDYKA